MRHVVFVLLLAGGAAALPRPGATAPLAPAMPAAPAAGNRSVIPAQAPWQWWEREHEERRARERYWRLSPERRGRYNELQARIDRLQRRRQEIDQRIREAVREQHDLLGLRER